MKLWEVLKALEEGSKSVYEHKSGDSPSIVILEKYADGWTEVKQPVTWQEALEAWVNGKTVKCMQGGYSYIYSNREQLFIDNRTRNTMSKYDLKEGTWYIEN